MPNTQKSKKESCCPDNSSCCPSSTRQPSRGLITEKVKAVVFALAILGALALGAYSIAKQDALKSKAESTDKNH